MLVPEGSEEEFGFQDEVVTTASSDIVESFSVVFLPSVSGSSASDSSWDQVSEAVSTREEIEKEVDIFEELRTSFSSENLTTPSVPDIPSVPEPTYPGHFQNHVAVPEIPSEEHEGLTREEALWVAETVETGKWASTSFSPFPIAI